jgi:hypothetical protein
VTPGQMVSGEMVGLADAQVAPAVFTIWSGRRAMPGGSFRDTHRLTASPSHRARANLTI